ncbi:MAG: hypothetical protein ABI333_18830 [bacterium]
MSPARCSTSCLALAAALIVLGCTGTEERHRFVMHHQVALAGSSKTALLVVGYRLVLFGIGGQRFDPGDRGRLGYRVDVVELAAERRPTTVLVGYLTSTRLRGSEEQTWRTAKPIALTLTFEPGQVYFARGRKQGPNVRVWIEKGGPRALTSPDGKRTLRLAKICRAKQTSGACRYFFVVRSGAEEARYPLFGFPYNDPQYSRDGRRVAFFSRTSRGIFAVVDGVRASETASVGAIVSNWANVPVIVFGPRSRRLAYWVETGSKRVVVVDGVRGKAYDSIAPPRFSPDGSKLGYAAYNYAVRGKERYLSESFVVINGVERSAVFPPVDSPRFSPDGKHRAYVGVKSGAGAVVVMDGDARGRFKQVRSHTLRFDASGEGLSFEARSAGDTWQTVTLPLR